MSDRAFDMYRHLSDDPKDGITVVVGVEEVAARVSALNYGTHRLLCALVRIRLRKRPDDELALGIKALLDKGLY